MSVVIALALMLTACSGDNGPDASDAPSNSSTESDPSTGADATAEGEQPSTVESADAGLPGDLPDFPFPDDYTVVTAGSNSGAWTVMLNVPGGWEDMKAFYQEELPLAGWTIQGDRPFVTKDGTELDASKDNLEVTVGISFVSDATSLVINLVQQ